MSGVSIDDFGASFIHYLPGLIEVLNNTTVARTLVKGEIKWEGTHLEKKMHISRNSALTFQEDGGPIPPASAQAYLSVKATRRFLVGQVKVTDGILYNAKTTKDSAINVVDSELRGMLDGVRKLENFFFTRDGTGVVATLGATTSGATITVSDGRAMWRTADFTVLDTDGSTQHGTFVTSKKARAFTTAGEVTVTPSASFTGSGSQATGDYIVWGSGSKMMYNRAPTGLDALVDDGTGTFQNINCTTYNEYTSPVLSNAGDARPITSSLLRQLMAAVKSESGQDVNSEFVLLGNYWQGINFEEMFEGEVRITETTKVGGIEITKFQSALGSMSLVMDPDSPYEKLFLADMSQISRASQAELDWRGNGTAPGAIFQRNDAAMSHTATCLEIYEYFIEQRNRCGKIEDITETRATALG